MKLETKYIAPLGIEIEFKVGQNAHDNFAVIESSNITDLWFHISDNSSSHVVASIPPDIQFEKKQMMYIVKQGAILCKQHSRYKSQKNVSVVYTTIQNITLTNIPGSVTIQNSKTVII
jgi:predicted ribosome quality control (RQC) complex YloA/Tae2 family protein